MSKRYVLAQMVLSNGGAIELSKKEYEAIVRAVEKLLSCLDAEEKFDCVIENYRDLEKYILDQAFQALFSRGLDDVASQSPRNTTSRKLSNLLSSVRLYQDTIGRDTKVITGDDAAAAQITADKSRQFDASLSYRILDALRNHAQHHALPVHGYSIGSKWTEGREISEHEFEAVISVSELAANADFGPPKTLAELKAGPEKLELKPMVREYVECLSTIHQQFRELTKSAVDQQLMHHRGSEGKVICSLPGRARHRFGRLRGGR